MHKVMLFLAILASLSFAAPSEKLPLPGPLQKELPWFATMAKDDNGTYNSVFNKNNLKEIVKQKNSKKVVFSFFATWCIPCREGLKHISEKAAELEKRGVLIILINVGEEDFSKVENFAKPYAKKEWLLAFDRFGNIPLNFGIQKEGEDMPFPRTLILDSNLRPLTLIGQEGNDFLQILWSANE